MGGGVCVCVSQSVSQGGRSPGPGPQRGRSRPARPSPARLGLPALGQRVNVGSPLRGEEKGESGELLPRDPGSGSGRKGRAGAGGGRAVGGGGAAAAAAAATGRSKAEGRQGEELRAGALEASGEERRRRKVCKFGM